MTVVSGRIILTGGVGICGVGAVTRVLSEMDLSVQGVP